MNKKILVSLLLLASQAAFAAHGEGNTTNDSFNRAKRQLEDSVYTQIERKTVYCDATFNDDGKIVDANGFESSKYKKRGKKVEWEHVVPAEFFGRTFVEWREGDENCVTRKGKYFKGRNCASKTNMQYRYMQSDMYNLYPAIGAVNAMRRNYRYAAVAHGTALGKCEMIISSGEKKAVPPDSAKGVVARVSLYFADTYERYKLMPSQRKLFEAWDKAFPVTNAECERNDLIERIQGNVNSILKERCK